MDQLTAQGLQLEAIRRCQDPKPIPAEDRRKMLGVFALFPAIRSPFEVQILIARVALDQSVRLEESIDKLERKSSRLSRLVIYLNVILALLTLALFVLAFVTYAKG
jgi:hypothetical protein